MNIHIFQSHEGDCLMIEDANGEHRILCDGGTEAAMKNGIAVELAAWEQEGKEIDLVYVSHIDADHIGGVFILLDALKQWKVYDIHQNAGDPSAKPKLPRPPTVHALWHNAFEDLVDNAGAIESVLAASAPLLQASQVEELAHLGHEYAQIATSIPQALMVSRLVKADMLDISLNALPNNPKNSGKLLMARTGQQSEQIGTLKVSILCPTKQELENLRTGWNTFIENPGKSLDTLNKARQYIADGLDAADPFAKGNPLDLFGWNGTKAYRNVNTPNVASTVLMVEENNKRILMTGDNHPDMIVAGLKHGKYLKKNCIHLDVLKYPHHGSHHNITNEFPRQVSADHYIFCGNGRDTNPEKAVLEQLFESRVGDKSARCYSELAQDRPFKFWFSTSSHGKASDKQQAHMRMLETWAREKEAEYPELFEAIFSDAPYITLTP